MPAHLFLSFVSFLFLLLLSGPASRLRRRPHRRRFSLTVARNPSIESDIQLWELEEAIKYGRDECTRYYDVADFEVLLKTCCLPL
ncbi:hypothetical protein Droror1_Dr00015146 [Drosera rotundifolia]